MVRPGYLFTALGHPVLGRPIVIRNVHGTSIPHLEPADIAMTPVVRLLKADEDYIADAMEEAVNLRVKADALETELTERATGLVDRFLGGDFTSFA